MILNSYGFLKLFLGSVAWSFFKCSSEHQYSETIVNGFPFSLYTFLAKRYSYQFSKIIIEIKNSGMCIELLNICTRTIIKFFNYISQHMQKLN
jgi:hypothetical protein